MNNYLLYTESTADLAPDMIADLDINVIPMIFRIDDKDYLNHPDGSDLGFKEFYAMLREGKMSSTSQINAPFYLEEFAKPLDEGKDILYLCFSSGASGTYEQAVMAAKELNAKYGENRVVVIDTKAASMGQGLVVYTAAKMRKDGDDINKVAGYIKDNLQKFCHRFTVDDLNHLKRGGRLSAPQAFLGTILNVKPVLHVNSEGKLVPILKARGRKKSIDALADFVVRGHTDNTNIFISHGDCIEDAELLANILREKINPKNIAINYIGPVIGSHSGPGTLAVFYIGKER